MQDRKCAPELVLPGDAKRRKVYKLVGPCQPDTAKNGEA